MSIFAISDLHLALSIDKPMDIFGERWYNYMERLKQNWIKVVKDEDYIIIPGDISWATYLEQAYEDFNFIQSLPGKKIISKGNHDYWWTTLSKLNKFLDANNFKTISFMHNNSYNIEGTTFCGTRGWKCPGDDEFSKEDEKIYERELQRLELSLKSSCIGTAAENIIVAMHYPPFNAKKEPSEFVEIMRKYNVRRCIYGHLHGAGFKSAVVGEFDGIEFNLVSADFLNFEPLKL
ncbi:metallophosphoesterase [Acetivibrio clariflavus]|uniref:metallophosphoesterase n=1 Tax=Acetivibrio clariflavus TaxID=288965 RepID=UPI0004867D0C|nr:metallophosphoesterase [Acetivibrio clariflavus]